MCCSSFVVGLLLLGSVPPADPNLMPLSKLLPAQLQTGISTLSYRISTQSDECQKYFDLGLGYYYSYVWTESARCFETAARHDPQCAMCWWGLSRALQQWPARAGKANDALKKAYALIDQASYSEKQLILARAFEQGVAKDAPADASARKLKAQSILDELLMLHADDEEAWMNRGLIASEGKFFGGKPASAPYYLALTRLNPVHPGANHELLHQYETSKRPALGWVYSEKYIESSPGIPHAWHMQGHLSTRLGRWEHAADQALKSITIQRLYNQKWKVKPGEDHQWSHHLETCLEILTHQGRFREAQQVYEEMKALNYNKPEIFGRYFLASHDTASLKKWIEENRSKDKVITSYIAALHYLEQCEFAKAKQEIDVLDEAIKGDKRDKKLELKIWEARGLAMCKSGLVDQGLALLQKSADASKNDYQQHAWGHGAYFMEVWGLAALAAGRDSVAEEALLEAIAHDPGSFRGALGMQVLCERLGRPDEARQYQQMAEKAWQHADVKTYTDAVAQIRQLKTGVTLSTSAGQ